MKFKDKIKELRNREHMTQEELAEKLFVNRSLISKWENGSRIPGVDDLERISSIFGVSLDELITGNERLKDPIIKIVFSIDKKKRTEIVLLSIVIVVICIRIIIDLFATYLELDSLTTVFLHFFQETIWDIFIIISSFRCIVREEVSNKEPFSMIALSLSLIGKITSLLVAYLCLYFEFGDLGNSLIGFCLYSFPSFLLLYVIYQYRRNRMISVSLFLKIGLLLYIAFYVGRTFYWGTTFTTHLAFYLSRSLPEIVISVTCLYQIQDYSDHSQDIK